MTREDELGYLEEDKFSNTLASSHIGPLPYMLAAGFLLEPWCQNDGRRGYPIPLRKEGYRNGATPVCACYFPGRDWSSVCWASELNMEAWGCSGVCHHHFHPSSWGCSSPLPNQTFLSSAYPTPPKPTLLVRCITVVQQCHVGTMMLTLSTTDTGPALVLPPHQGVYIALSGTFTKWAAPMILAMGLSYLPWLSHHSSMQIYSEVSPSVLNGTM